MFLGEPAVRVLFDASRRSLLSDVDRGSQSASGSKRGAPLSSDSGPPQGWKTQAGRTALHRLV